MAHSWWVWGRILYSIPLAATGIIYLVNPSGTVESMTSFIPGGHALIYVGGILWLALGLASAFSFRPRLASLGIIALLCAYLILVHVPAATSGEYLNVVWFELLRSLSLMGGAFFLMAVEGHHMKPEQMAEDLTTFGNEH